MANTEIKWIKITTNMFDDEKIKIIESMPEADMILIIWVKLLTLAGKKNMNGYIFLTENIPYTDETLSTIFNRPVNTIRLALDIFKKFNMIQYDGNNNLKITNWEKYQNIEGLEKIREQNRLRQQKFREEHKELPVPKEEVTLHNVTVTEQNRLDKNRLEEDKNNYNIYVEEIFNYWKETFKHPKAILSKDRKEKIRARIREGYTVEDCKKAIYNCSQSPYHMGKNDKNQRYDSIGLIFRNADKLEWFINMNDVADTTNKNYDKLLPEDFK